MQTWLAWNLPCRLLCLLLLCMRITGVNHHTWLSSLFLPRTLNGIPVPDKTGTGICLISLPLEDMG